MVKPSSNTFYGSIVTIKIFLYVFVSAGIDGLGEVWAQANGDMAASHSYSCLELSHWKCTYVSLSNVMFNVMHVLYF